MAISLLIYNARSAINTGYVEERIPSVDSRRRCVRMTSDKNQATLRDGKVVTNDSRIGTEWWSIRHVNSKAAQPRKGRALWRMHTRDRCKNSIEHAKLREGSQLVMFVTLRHENDNGHDGDSTDHWRWTTEQRSSTGRTGYV